MHPEGYEQVWAELPTLLFIPLTQGKFTVIDGVDYPKVSGYRWCAVNCGRGSFRAAGRKGSGKRVYMHHLIRPRIGDMLDHADRCPLNNRKGNLRDATRSQNSANSNRVNSLGYRGLGKAKNRYTAYIASGNPKRPFHYLGLYTTPEDAAKAYDLAALVRFGEFARLNFPDRLPEYLKQIESERISA
jgi:hypothetical protein